MFRREVSGRTERDSGLRQAVDVSDRFGNPKVHELDQTVFEDMDVRWLDIPVNDSSGMGELEPFGDLKQQRDDRQRILLEQMFAKQIVDVVPIEELLHEVWNLILNAEIENQRDIGMNEISNELGFFEEPLPDLRIGRRTGLDGDVSLDEGVPCLVDDAEAAYSDLVPDLVFSDVLQHLCMSSPPRHYSRPGPKDKGSGRLERG